MRNTSGSVTFIAALLFRGAQKLTNKEKAIIHSKTHSFAGVFCDDNFCSVFIPYSQMRNGCLSIQKLAQLLALDNECDDDDAIHLELIK